LTDHTDVEARYDFLNFGVDPVKPSTATVDQWCTDADNILDSMYPTLNANIKTFAAVQVAMNVYAHYKKWQLNEGAESLDGDSDSRFTYNIGNFITDEIMQICTNASSAVGVYAKPVH
jgi:hypothetical protein